MASKILVIVSVVTSQTLPRGHVFIRGCLTASVASGAAGVWRPHVRHSCSKHLESPFWGFDGEAAMKMTLQTYPLQTRHKATVAIHRAGDDTGQSSVNAETRVGKLASVFLYRRRCSREVQQSQAQLRWDRGIGLHSGRTLGRTFSRRKLSRQSSPHNVEKLLCAKAVPPGHTSVNLRAVTPK